MIPANSAFASERIDRCSIVVADLALLCIVSHAHPDVMGSRFIVAVIAAEAPVGFRTRKSAGEEIQIRACLPNRIRQLEARYEHTLINLTGPLAECAVSCESQCARQKIAGKPTFSPDVSLGRRSRTVPSLRLC